MTKNNMTGSKLLDNGDSDKCTLDDPCDTSKFRPCSHTTTGLHRFFSIMTCLTAFKKDNNLLGYHTRYDDGEGCIKLGWMTGLVIVQWFQDSFIIEYEDLTIEEYRSLRKSLGRYWKRDKPTTKLLTSRLKVSKF